MNRFPFSAFKYEARSSGARAFTLIELLAVIAIIAILAILAIGPVKSFLDRGKETTCVSNLRQIGTAIASYAAEHNNELPFDNSPNQGEMRWYIMLNPYLGKSTKADDGGWAAPSVFICPSNDPHTGDGGGGKYKIWSDYGYASNLALMPRKSGEAYYPSRPPARLSSLPSRHVLVADVGKNRSQFLKATDAGLPYSTVENARIHRGGVNMLWTDFSVSFRKAEDVVNDEGKKFCWF